MSKKLKTIIVGGGVLLLLSAAVVVLLLLPKGNEGEAASSSPYDSEVITVLEAKEGDELSSIHVKNQKDEYTVETLGEKKWGIKALDGFPQEDVFTSIMSSMKSIYANSLVEENVADLSKFGLDAPSLVLDLTYVSGEKHTITVGDINENSYSAYTVVDDGKTVYQVAPSKYSELLKGKLEFLSKAIVPPLEADEAGNTAAPNIEAMEFTGENPEMPFVFKKVDMTQKSKNYMPMAPVLLEAPVKSEVNGNLMEKSIYPVFGLTAYSVAAINPTEEQLAEFGLKETASVFSLSYNETLSIKLLIGSVNAKLEDEAITDVHLYVKPENESIVYIVPKASMPWLTVKAREVISSIAVLAPILDLKGVDVTIDGKTYKVAYTHGEGDDAVTDMTATINSEKADVELAKKHLQLLYATSIEDLNKDAAATAENPDVTIVYNYLDGKTDKVELYEGADRKTIVSVNGNNAFIGRPGYIEKLKKETQNFVDGKTVNTEW